MSTHKVEMSVDLDGFVGDMDRHFATGQAAPGQRPPAANPSIQRQAYLQGPNLTTRQLDDDEEFEGCNYYKQVFGLPSLTYLYLANNLDEARGKVLSTITDDGSVHPDGRIANGVAVSHAAGTPTTSMTNVAALNGGNPASFVVIQNDATSASPMTVDFNGGTTGFLTVAAGAQEEIRVGGISSIWISTSDVTNPSTGQITFSSLVPCN